MGEPHFLRASGQVFMYFQIVTNLGIQHVRVQAYNFFFWISGSAKFSFEQAKLGTWSTTKGYPYFE